MAEAERAILEEGAQIDTLLLDCELPEPGSWVRCSEDVLRLLAREGFSPKIIIMSGNPERLMEVMSVAMVLYGAEKVESFHKPFRVLGEVKRAMGLA
ncbi:MAG: hypothetical protein Q8Q32_01660 [bacterium]|nr:hypothetical protein [bacterium]